MLDLGAWPEAPPAMDAVQSLVDKSLLRSWVRTEHDRFDIDEPYFGMYLSIHEYAAGKLDASGSTAQERRSGGTRGSTPGSARRPPLPRCRCAAAASGAVPSPMKSRTW